MSSIMCNAVDYLKLQKCIVPYTHNKGDEYLKTDAQPFMSYQSSSLSFHPRRRRKCPAILRSDVRHNSLLINSYTQWH